MKRSAIEQKLNEAAIRSASADSQEWRLTREIDFHDREATRIRKERQKFRSKKDRANAAIRKYSALLQIHLE